MKFELFQYGGQAEIRTQERSRVAGFQDRCIQPLCHLSANGMSLIIEEKCHPPPPIEVEVSHR